MLPPAIEGGETMWEVRCLEKRSTMRAFPKSGARGILNEQESKSRDHAKTLSAAEMRKEGNVHAADRPAVVHWPAWDSA